MDDQGTASSVVMPVVYSVGEAAEALRLSRALLYQLIRSGRLRTIKVGGRRLVPGTALVEFVEGRDDAA